MPITNSAAGTRIDEIDDGVFRISTPVPPSVVPGGFSFNQFLIRDEKPMLFHTGSRRLFPLVREAIAHVLAPGALSFVAFSHYEQDECGALNEFLSVAANATPVCGRINAMINSDGMDRAAMALGDGETLLLGKRRLRWFDMPHLPHGWDCGYLMDETTGVLFCGDLFTQGGADLRAIVESDVLGPSEKLREQLDYYSHARDTRRMLDRLAQASPRVLACMHGSAWRGDGGQLLRDLADCVEGPRRPE